MSMNRRLEKLEAGQHRREGDECVCAPGWSSEIRIWYHGKQKDERPAVRCDRCGGAKRLIFIHVINDRSQVEGVAT